MVVELIVRTAIVLGVLALVFAVIERLFGGPRLTSRGRGVLRVDLTYWVLGALTRPVARFCAVIGLVVIAVVAFGGAPREALRGFESILAEQPIWLQSVELLILSDLIGYGIHRLKHTDAFLWRVHAVHHSPKHLDWLAAGRLHPIDEIVAIAGRALVLVPLGFSLDAFAISIPGAGFYALLLHTNLDWRYGPLRYLIASPVFHRHHHSRLAGTPGKNFAGIFPLWDLIFGTFEMPEKAPHDFGVDDRMPATMWGQLTAPFRGGSPAAGR